MAYIFASGESSFGTEPPTSDYLDPIGGGAESNVSIDQSDDGGARQFDGKYYEGRAVANTGLPISLRRAPAGTKQLMDLYSAPKYMFYISPKLKEIIEDIEPDVHQIIPLELKLHGSKVTPFYFMNVCQRISAIAEDHTHPPLRMGRRMRYRRGNDGNDVLAFSKDAIAGKHLWAEMHWKGIWMSDALHDACREAKLSGVLKTERVPEF